MRMTPAHVTRKFWWELIFINLLLFLLAGARSQGKHARAAATQVTGAPAAELSAVVIPLPPPLILK